MLGKCFKYVTFFMLMVHSAVCFIELHVSRIECVNFVHSCILARLFRQTCQMRIHFFSQSCNLSLEIHSCRRWSAVHNIAVLLILWQMIHLVSCQTFWWFEWLTEASQYPNACRVLIVGLPIFSWTADLKKKWYLTSSHHMFDTFSVI